MTTTYEVLCRPNSYEVYKFVDGKIIGLIGSSHDQYVSRGLADYLRKKEELLPTLDDVVKALKASRELDFDIINELTGTDLKKYCDHMNHIDKVLNKIYDYRMFEDSNEI